ncbi:hypothetical protein OPIT5_14730 [Opitutaceae bacterium TAV5]|nr:hypothetical protein OPIT5_14730 [Opitutaceae bacterium TAV5]
MPGQGGWNYWIGDPAACVVKVYNLAENADVPLATLTEGRVLTSPPLPDLKISVTDLFAAS